MLGDFINIYRSIPYHMLNIISKSCSWCEQSFSFDSTIDQLRCQIADFEYDHLKLTFKISSQLAEIGLKDKILEERLLQYAHVNHFIGYLYNILDNNPLLLPTICGFLVAFPTFHFIRRNIYRIELFNRTIQRYVWQLTCWVCRRSQDLETQIRVLSEHTENFTRTNDKLGEISCKLTNHIQHLNGRIDYLTKEIEKCDWTNLLNMAILNDQFIKQTIASACLFIIPLLIACMFIESKELSGFNRNVNNAVSFIKGRFSNMKF